MNRAVSRSPLRAPAPVSGLGVACREAQADGVPCDRVAATCADCERGVRAEVAATHPSDSPLTAADGGNPADA